MRLAGLPWTEVAQRAPASLLAIPLGSTEQHGPHLPLSTDADMATALADAMAARRTDVLVAPALAYGASGEHADFPGTLSIGHEALERLILELVRSADAFAGVVLVNGHGGNQSAVTAAASRLHAEGRRVLAWSPDVPDGDAHAGRTETSLLLAIRPAAVRASAAVAGEQRPLRDLMPALLAGGVAAVSANGVLGDPAGATAAEGAALLDRLTADLVAAVGRWSIEHQARPAAPVED